MPHIGERWMTVGDVGLPPSAVTPTGSPFVWTASNPGALVISGGTVSVVEVGRGAVWVVSGLLGGMIPVSAGDKVRMTYLVAPTVTFIGR